MSVKELLKRGFLVKIEPDMELSKKETKEAEYDMMRAKEALSSKDYKWAIIKSYYAMFHAAKSILYGLGYKEKKHISVLAILEEMSKKGKLESRYVTYFKASMSARKDADYSYSYSKEIAEYELEITEDFIERIKRIKPKL